MTANVDTPADTTTMAELFERDPLSLGQADIELMVGKLRAQRKNFVSGNKGAGTPAKKKSKATLAQEKALAVAGDINLDDLGLDL